MHTSDLDASVPVDSLPVEQQELPHRIECQTILVSGILYFQLRWLQLNMRPVRLSPVEHLGSGGNRLSLLLE